MRRDSSIRECDCVGANRRLAIGHSNPGYTYGAVVEIYDFRMYVHSSTGPLTPRDVAGMATERQRK